MMEKSDRYKLRNITREILGQVAEIHRKAFPESFLSLLDKKTIIKYYDWQMTPPNICYAFGVSNNDNQLIGFCFAGSLRNAKIYFIQDNFIFIAAYFLRHPRLLFNHTLLSHLGHFLKNLKDHLIQGKWRRTKEQQVRSDRFGILSVAVDHGFQRIGIGELLMNHTEQYAIKNGYQKIELSVHPENQKAVSFYDKLGWKKVLYDREKPWQGYMKKRFRKLGVNVYSSPSYFCTKF